MQTPIELRAYCEKNDIPKFRAKQILHAIFREGVSSYEGMAVLPKQIREKLEKDAPVFCLTSVFEAKTKNGDTIKTLFALRDGNRMEGVLMKFNDGRNSVCVSSQVGCGLKCKFCLTGQLGFTRNLTAEEIADQVLYFDQYIKKNAGDFVGKGVTNVVFMGMGEPFLNYENVTDAILRLNDPECLGLAARRITVSTSGIVPGIKKLMDFPLQVNLAVSIHAPTQELREQLMPIAKAYPLESLITEISNYEQKTRRRVSYEYVMLKSVNDSPGCARQLAGLIRGQRAHVNLIPYNETRLGFVSSGKARIDRFKEILDSFGIAVTVRVSLGQDISAACGQLGKIKI